MCLTLNQGHFWYCTLSVSPSTHIDMHAIQIRQAQIKTLTWKPKPLEISWTFCYIQTLWWMKALIFVALKLQDVTIHKEFCYYVTIAVQEGLSHMLTFTYWECHLSHFRCGAVKNFVKGCVHPQEKILLLRKSQKSKHATPFFTFHLFNLIYCNSSTQRVINNVTMLIKQLTHKVSKH